MSRYRTLPRRKVRRWCQIWNALSPASRLISFRTLHSLFRIPYSRFCQCYAGRHGAFRPDGGVSPTTRRWGWTWSLLLLCLPILSGCAICCGDDDYNYSAYGGSWQRADMSNGRVGSAFGFAGEVSELQIESAPLETPSVVDELPAPEASMSDR